MAEPMRASNSFVGTEEYIAPVCFLLEPAFHIYIYIFDLIRVLAFLDRGRCGLSFLRE